jgi:hypothetical protein
MLDKRAKSAPNNILLYGLVSNNFEAAKIEIIYFCVLLFLRRRLEYLLKIENINEK